MIGDIAVVSAQTQGSRSTPRMLSWAPGHGADEMPGFPTLKVGQLAEAAGLHEGDVRAVTRVLGARTGRPVERLQELMKVLALPGAAMLRGEGVKSDLEAVLVEPDKSAVGHFEKVARDEDDMRAELREHS